MSSIKREVRGQDSYILELRKFSCRYKGCLAAGMDFNIIVPVFARNTKRVKHILLSHQLKLDPTSTDIKPKFFCYQWCSDGAAVASTEKSSSLVKGLSSSGCQLGRDVSRTWHAAATRMSPQSHPPFVPEKGIQQNLIYKNWSQLGNEQLRSAQWKILTSPQRSKQKVCHELQ